MMLDASEIRSLELFDANCRLGPGEFTGSTAPVTSLRLLEEMARVGIHEALVYHSTAAQYAPNDGNAQLLSEIEGRPLLHGSYVALPHYTGEVKAPAGWVEVMLSSAIRAVRLLPRSHRYMLNDWCLEELLEHLAPHNIPVFLDFNRTHWAEDVVDYDQVASICKRHPMLPVILVREGIGSTRCLYSLLERFQNVFIEISYYQAAGGLADITRRYGAERLLFGTGLPDYSAGPAIAMLGYADLSFADKKKIAGDNLRRLLASAGLNPPYTV